MVLRSMYVTESPHHDSEKQYMQSMCTSLRRSNHTGVRLSRRHSYFKIVGRRGLFPNRLHFHFRQGGIIKEGRNTRNAGTEERVSLQDHAAIRCGVYVINPETVQIFSAFREMLDHLTPAISARG